MTGESLQHKSWQPQGGEIQFTISSFVAIPADATVWTCFRWKTIPDSTSNFSSVRPSRLEMDSDGKLLKITTTVPVLGPQPDNIRRKLPLVPLSDVRIVVVDNSKNELVADVATDIGITYPWAAIALAGIATGLGYLVLRGAAAYRLKHPGIMQAGSLLRIVSTPSGFASLSQVQILLWTFVVAASAVYVMSLSGELIEITNGTLVLLGIAGAAGIGAKAHSEAQSATAEAAAAKADADKAAAEIAAAEKAAAAAAPPADPVAAARIAAEKVEAEKERAAKAEIAKASRAKADAMKKPPEQQVPKWSDLILNENVKDDGIVTREIDVARFQMLLFTLITATFVLMNVVTTYVIPDISVGFQTLLGISNGVYLGSKVAQGS